MHEWNSLSHVRWDCKYHVVFVPKYRKKQLYGQMRKRVRAILWDSSRQIPICLHPRAPVRANPEAP